jgi:hypothetical protein
MADFAKSERELLIEISAKLDRLVAVSAIVGLDEDDRIDVLIRLGVDAKLISSLTGLTRNAIAIRKTRAKKEQPSKMNLHKSSIVNPN